MEIDDADGAQGCGSGGGQGDAAAVVDLEGKPGQIDDFGILQGVAAENGQPLGAVLADSMSRGEEIVIAEVLGQSGDQQGAPVRIVLYFLEKEQIGLEELDAVPVPVEYSGRKSP